MNKKLKWILIIAGAAIIIFGSLKVLGGGNKGLKVSAEKATIRTIVETVSADGNVYPEVEVKISPDISGEITELRVEEGDSVKKGDILARIFADIYALQRDEAASQVNRAQATVENSEAALDALKATLDQARQTYDRNKKLYDDKVISKSELEQYETSYRSALANYNAAKENIRSLEASVAASKTGLTRANKDLSRTTLVAPMDGIISSLKVKEGERVAGNSFTLGTEMMTVADMSVLEVRVNVGENDIVKVNYGDSAEIEIDAYNNRKFRGVVTKIASSTSTSAAAAAVSNEVTNYEVRIRLDPASYQDLVDPANKRRMPFRPGMSARAEIKTKRHDNVLSVPIMSVTSKVKGSDQSMADKKKEEQEKRGGEDNAPSDVPVASNTGLEEVAFVLQTDGTVKRTVVKTGIQDITYIEIVNGLKEGEEIISGPYNAVSEKLKDGMKVSVVPREQLFQK